MCSGCKKNLFIVNKKYNLCDDCNYFRLHKITKQEALVIQQRKYQEKYSKKQVTKVPIKTKIYTIKQSSSKDSSVKEKLGLLKKDIRLEAIQNDLHFCQGCGKGVGLDCSHILSVKQRKDLELAKKNIDLLCRSCHESWESKNAIRLLKLDCLERYLEYIENEDREALVKLIIIIDDFLISLPDTFDLELEEIVRKAIYLSKKFN